MTVAELIAELENLPQDAEVVLAEDAEGNGFKALSTVDPTRWDDGELVWTLSASGAQEEHADIDDEGAEGKPCVVLWP